ncbi:hypothetical protein RJ639_041317 [Escallonia herrerae]|uniref:Reverse transcriptase domain-containing protein n=1 Tax=Escallonia herrerae TaxID=1293975 RepID=A0AA88WF37_9ASTE|nr:hypothetical protein RJ639_041317 [Escallonia herrerae]
MRSRANKKNKELWCHFHNDHGHKTNNCGSLKRAIEALIKRGQLRKFVAQKEDTFAIEEREEREENVDVKTPHDDPLVITIKVANFNVKCVLVDNGSSAEVLFYDAFQKMNILTDYLRKMDTPLYGFSNLPVTVEGVIALPVGIGTPPAQANLMLDFVVVKNKEALIIKDFWEDTKMQRGKLVEDLVSIKVYPRGKDKMVWISSNLKEDTKLELVDLLRTYADIFTWIAADMPGIDPKVITHRLNVDPYKKHVKQKKRTFAPKRQEKTVEVVEKLLIADFIEEIYYPDWITNIVMVPKPGGRWRICIDYTDLNKACPKDSYPLPKIDLLIDATSGHELLSFMDAKLKDFTWTDNCQKSFEELKAYLASPPLLSKPLLGENLFLYLSVTEVAVNVVLVREEESKSRSIMSVRRFFSFGSSGAGIILISPEGFVVEYALRFGF